MIPVKLKDVCTQTGLSRKTIRLYEEKGLITPQKEWRNGREYRNYSQADVSQLQRIALLRRAWFTMEEISRMQQDPESIPEIFEQYRQWLQNQKKDLDGLIAVTQQIEINTVADISQLTEEMEQAARELPLPQWDVNPRFRYLDEIEEEVRTMNQNPEKQLQESRQKTYRQTLLMLDQDKINNHAITFGQIKEVEETNWNEDKVLKEEEHLPKVLQILSRISFGVMLAGIVVFCAIYAMRVFMTFGITRELPTASIVALWMMILGALVYAAIRGYAAWKERQAWILRMRQQDLEKQRKK